MTKQMNTALKMRTIKKSKSGVSIGVATEYATFEKLRIVRQVQLL